jgi:glycerophosphoryl diester phosphodiesterase
MALLIAHRGASSEAPENTLAAYKRALKLGVDAIEIDVHLTADGQLVVIHDATVGRTAWGAAGKRISEMNLPEIQSLDAGSWFSADFAGEKIPTLDQLLQVDRGSTLLMVEVKRGHVPLTALTDALLNVLQKATGSLVIGSFSAPLLEMIQQRAPELPLIGLVEDAHLQSSFHFLKLKKMGFWYKLITPTLLSSLHEEGQEVWTFTVDEPETARFLLSIGIDGLITNRPRQLKNLMQAASRDPS